MIIEITMTQLLLLVLIAPIVSALFVLAADHFYTRHLRKAMTLRENEVLRHARALDKEVQLLAARERRVRRAEQKLHRHAKEVSAVVSREHDHFDTMISVAELPNPVGRFENDDTVAIPVVKEE